VTKTKKPAFSWDNVSQEQQIKLLETIGGDGHTIWSAPGLIEDGIDGYIIGAFTTVEKSDGSWKGSIFNSSGMVDELRGVYGLTVIRSLASHYGESSSKFGRGSEARELTEKIRKHLGVEAA
jgi:hypothetical protein